jgi:hypothetical protein
MRRFLYFIEGLQGQQTRESVLRAVQHLVYAFPTGCPFTAVECVAGPGGAAGVVCAYGDAHGCKYDKAAAVDWIAAGPGVRLGVPRDPAERPGPDELGRYRRHADGTTVTLGDGRGWIVPVIRFLNGNTGLPRILAVGPDGDALWQVRPEFVDLFHAARNIMDRVLEGGGAAYSAADLLWFATETLGVNYRMSKFEIAALGLITSETVKEIADAALDGETTRRLLDELKKKLAERLPFGQGLTTGAGGLPDTVPPGAK